jgi:hypothetical protein
MSNLAGLPPLGLKDRTPKKDPAHLSRVATLPCCVCEAFGLVQIGPTYVHHTICGRYSQEKTPDRMTIPLCYAHHQGEFGIHTDKAAWVQEFGDDRDYIAPTLDNLGV